MALRKKVFLGLFVAFYLVISSLALVHMHPSLEYEDSCSLCHLSTVIIAILLFAFFLFSDESLVQKREWQIPVKIKQIFSVFILLPRPPPIFS